MKPGIKLLEDEMGTGDPVQKGDLIEVEYDLYLNGGDLIQPHYRAQLTLGDRNMIAGLNYGIEVMRVGGRRKFKASPHLCYRDAGVPPAGIPAHAVLIFDVRLLAKGTQNNLGQPKTSPAGGG